jgi:hypothetical protein
MREHTGTSVAIGALSAIAYTLWGGVLAVMLWGGITVYAIVKWIGSPADHASPTTILVLVVGLVAVYPLLLAVGIYVISKPMRYARRRTRDDDREQLALPIGEDPETA